MVEKVLASSSKSPGIGVRVNLVSGTKSAGGGVLRALLLCVAASTGTATDHQLYESVAGPDEVATLGGAGSPAHLGAEALFAEHPTAQVDVVFMADPAGTAASEDIVFSGTPTQDRLVKLKIAGRLLTFTWFTGESATVAGDRAESIINGNGGKLPVTASNTTGTVTLTYKSTGTAGNDCLISAELEGGAGGSVAAGAAALSGGVGAVDASSALAVVTTIEYDYIIPECGNTDANAASDTTPIGRVETHMGTYDEGLNALLQQAIYGSTGTLSATKTGTAQRNDPRIQCVMWQSAQSLPFELACAEAGARMREVAIDPAVNRIGQEYRATLYGPVNAVTSKLTPPQLEDALNKGVSPIMPLADGTPTMAQPITTYHVDASSNEDFRCYDTSQVDGVFAVVSDMRTFLPQEFPKAKLSEDLPANVQEIPPNVVQIKYIKAAGYARLRTWADLGVLDRNRLETEIAAGNVVFQIDSIDDSQVNVVLPLKTVPPLRKWSLVANQIT